MTPSKPSPSKRKKVHAWALVCTKMGGMVGRPYESRRDAETAKRTDISYHGKTCLEIVKLEER